MKILAIVGTSHLSEIEEMDARKRIVWSIKQFQFDNTLLKDDIIMIISGGAKGIDLLVKEICKEQNIQFLEILPEKQTWNYFKQRNIRIAQMADKVISISTAVKTINCYHCKNQVWTHERTGGCFTMKYAKHLNKSTELIIL